MVPKSDKLKLEIDVAATFWSTSAVDVAAMQESASAGVDVT